MSLSNSQNLQTPLVIINGCPTEINIQQRNYYYSSSSNHDPNDFVVDFTLKKLTNNRNHELLNYPKIIHKSHPLPFNPTKIFEINKIDFSLCELLRLRDYFELRQEIKCRIASYVELNPRPTAISVTIIVHQVNEVRETRVSRILRLLEKVKVEDYMKGFKEEEEEECCCSICLVKFEEQKEGITRMRRMPCKHVFHEECILKWLIKKPLCPLCRFKLHV